MFGLSLNHPGLEEAPSGGVGTGGNHTGLSPINRMTSSVHVLLGLRWPGHHWLLLWVLPVCSMYA